MTTSEVRSIWDYVGTALLVAIFILGAAAFTRTTFDVFAASVTSSVIVGNATPSVTSVVLNAGSAITLTSNATTSFNIGYTISDNNGCSDITGARTTTTVFRSGASGSCATATPTASNLNCYVYVTHTTSSCSGTSLNATDTVQIFYFGQATDASSSFESQDWAAFVIVADGSGATSSATSTHVELNTLTAIDVTTSSINYSTVAAGSNTGATNQIATSTNAGNSSTTLQLRASATLVSGSNSIATSSQRFATSTFTFPGGATQLTDSNVTVTGFLLTSPTSTTTVADEVFWGLEIPNGTATGTYTGTNAFTSLFQP